MNGGFALAGSLSRTGNMPAQQQHASAMRAAHDWVAVPKAFSSVCHLHQAAAQRMSRCCCHCYCQVIAGDDRGKVGTITKVSPKSGEIVVEGVNLKTKHIKPKMTNEKGSIVEVCWCRQWTSSQHGHG